MNVAAPFTIADIAEAAARLLGSNWTSTPGPWDVTGEIHAPTGQGFTIGVDHDGDLWVEAFTEPGPTPLSDARPEHGLDHAARIVAATVPNLQKHWDGTHHVQP
ncbi:hypothetical protein [Streptomyces sp. NPDC001948]